MNRLSAYFLSAGVACTFLFICSAVCAADKVVVVPLMGGAVGNATPADVLAGKTFSSSAGKGLVGTLEPHPMEQPFTNSINMTFNLIPAGTFIMGSPDGTGSEPVEPNRDTDESQHEVTLTRSFYMQITEVTNGHWDAVITDKGRGLNPSQSHTGDNYPIETVNWYEAASFANWLSYDEGLIPCYNGHGTCTGTLGDDFTCTDVSVLENCEGYLLPTEAQWEYAARAGTVTAYANPILFDTANTASGDNFNSNLHAMGWYVYNDAMENSDGVTAYEHGTKPVVAKQANRWGMYDMHGNVLEWCRDWYGPYPDGPVTDPSGPSTGGVLVGRGGGWFWQAEYARSAARSYYTPNERGNGLGFRLIRFADQ